MKANPNARVRNKADTHILATVLLVLFTLLIGYHTLSVFHSSASAYTLSAHFTLDVRSLALGRIGLGLLVIVDVMQSRWPLRGLFYTDQGFWPRPLILNGRDPQIHPTRDFSLYMAMGSEFWITTSFVGAIVAGSCVVLGHWTQTSLFLCWLHMYSLFYRGSGIQQAGDTLLRLLLFWSMFLPMGKLFSVDHALGGGGGGGGGGGSSGGNNSSSGSNSNGTGPTIVSVASCAVLIQMSMLYIFPAAFKVTPSWKKGTAIAYVLHNYAHARNNAVTRLLLSDTRYTTVLTYATPLVEHAAPLMLLFAPFRAVGVVVFVGFHTGLALTMRLGLFPFVSLKVFVDVMFAFVKSNKCLCVLFGVF